MVNSRIEWNRSGLSGEIADEIQIENGIKFMFPPGSDDQLSKFSNIGTSQDASRSPVLMVRCYNKSSITDLLAKAKRYNDRVPLGGIIVAVPEPNDNAVTQQAYRDAKSDINREFPDTPFIQVIHETTDSNGEFVNSFDAPQNLATAIILHQRKKYGITDDVPIWCHSYAPDLAENQLDIIRQSLAVAPYIVSVRTKYNDLVLPDGVTTAIQALRSNLDNLPGGLSQEHVVQLKQLFRSTCMVWSTQHQAEVTGGMNRLFGGERISIDHLPESVKPTGHDAISLKAGGEEDTEHILRLAQNPKTREILRQALGMQVLPYYDPDVHPGRASKFERAWNADPHPAHHFMFPQLAESNEQKAGIAIQSRIAENGHRIPEEWRGVKFV